jgi:hypothetical protein
MTTVCSHTEAVEADQIGLNSYHHNNAENS